jgi:hypothetical protein
MLAWATYRSASRAPRWNIAPPLAPGGEDVRFYEERAAGARDSARVSLNRVRRTWHERVPDPDAHRARLAWSEAAVANLEAWSRLESRYFFPNLAELRALAAPLFELEACDVLSYDWGEQFPRLVMRRAS